MKNKILIGVIKLVNSKKTTGYIYIFSCGSSIGAI